LVIIQGLANTFIIKSTVYLLMTLIRPDTKRKYLIEPVDIVVDKQYTT
jgi:hypothetical protein